MPARLLGTVYEWTNTASPDDYKADSYSRQCDACNGLGETKTGSKVQGQETLPCLECMGKGWVAVGDERSSGSMAVPNGQYRQVAPPAEDALPMMMAPEDEPPEVAALRKQGYAVVPPPVRA